MEIRKTKNGPRYREEIRIHGSKLKSPWFRRKTDAKSWKAKKIAEREEFKLTDVPIKKKATQKFSAYAEEWIEEKKRPFVSQSTYESYRANLKNHIFPIIGDIKLGHITDSHGYKLISHLRKSNHNSKGVNIIMGVAKSVFKHAVDEGVLFRSPFRSIPKQKEEIRKDVIWTKAEISQFLQANVWHPLYGVFFFALHTGARKGEILGLCWDRVDFKNNLITLSRTYGKYGLKETTKTNKKRVVPIFPELRKLLEQHFRDQKSSKFVFTCEDGRPINGNHIYRIFKKCQQEAGFENTIRFHDLRHVFASQFMENGGNIFELQKILGHTDPKMTTSRYAHFSPDHMQNSLQYMDLGARFEGAPPNRPQEGYRKGHLSVVSGS